MKSEEKIYLDTIDESRKVTKTNIMSVLFLVNLLTNWLKNKNKKQTNMFPNRARRGGNNKFMLHSN